MRKQMASWALVIGIIVAIPLLGVAQRGRGRGGGPPPTNLQVLPSDWSRQQVVQVMQNFTMALGVMCDHCHAAQAGAEPGQNGQIPRDFPSDDMQTKRTARVMMMMVGDINMRLGSELGKPADQVTQVQCVTCHRGSAVPSAE